MATPGGTLVNIQILRGLAATSVAVAHAASQFPDAGRPNHIDAAQAGVDVFFVISGFIMVYVTSKRPHGGWEFLLNRIHRIAPNYWFYTILTAALALVVPSAFRGTSFEPGHMVQSLLFIAHPNPALAASTSPILRVGWTLNYEMFFYVIFAAALVFGRNRVVSSAGVIAALVVIGFWVDDRGIVLRFYTSDIMIEFVFGMVIGLIHRSGLPRMGTLLPVVSIVVAVSAIIASSHAAEDPNAIRGLLFGVPAALVVVSCLMLPEPPTHLVTRGMRMVGDASYTIYLVHPFVLTFARLIAVRLGLVPTDGWGNLAFVVIATACAVGVGYGAFLSIERPLLRWSEPLFGRLKAPRSAPPIGRV